MTLAVLMALTAQFLFGISNIAGSFISNKIFKKVPTIVFYNGILNLLSIPIILSFGTPKFLPSDITIILLVLGSAFIDVIYQFPYYKALKILDTSIVVALFSIANIILPVMAYFMINEKLGIMQYLGFFIVIISNFALNISKSDINNKRFVINIGFYLMLFVSLILSFQTVLEKKILQNVDWVTFAFWFVILTSLLNFSIILWPKNRPDIKKSFVSYKKNFKVFLYMDLSAQMAMVLFFASLSQLPVVVVEGLCSTQAIFVLILGIILHKLYGDKFKEAIDRKDIRKKLICFMFIIFGVVLILM